jgi:hypothetical protein
MALQIILLLVLVFIAARLHFLVKEVEKTNQLIASRSEEPHQQNI